MADMKNESKTDKMRQLFADKQVGTEELENVAGGTKYETADDSRFLNVLMRGLPNQPNRYGETKVSYGVGESARRGEVMNAWNSLGVKMLTKSGDTKNQYWLPDGTPLTREQAWAHAEKVVGKHLQKSDWYWD